MATLWDGCLKGTYRVAIDMMAGAPAAMLDHEAKAGRD